MAMLAALMMLATACATDEPEEASPAPPPAPAPVPSTGLPGVEVHIVDGAFVPEEIEVTNEAAPLTEDEQQARPGLILTDPTTVRWLNRDVVEHTITFDDFDSGELPPGGVFQRSFTGFEPGDYDYACSLHPDETGTVTVVG